MIDLVGVGICIACLSYLCCMYTATFVAVSPKIHGRKHRSNRRRLVVSSTKTCTGEKASPPTCTENNYCENSMSRRKCPCAVSRCIERPPVEGPGRRKICLVASSFLDFESSEEGKDACKNGENEGLCYCPSGEKFQCGDATRRSCKQSECRF